MDAGSDRTSPSKTRAGFMGRKAWFVTATSALLFFSAAGTRAEEVRPWTGYQEEFKRLYVERATTKVQEAAVRNDTAEQTRWQRLLDEMSQAQPGIVEIKVEELKVTDRCATCHRGIDDPLFADAPQPLRAHSGEFLARHDIKRFGCTPCHDGNGEGTTVERAHGQESDAPAPRCCRVCTRRQAASAVTR
jgi:hypothetical protein